MKKILLYIVVFSSIISCGEKHTGNMLIKGNIDGLKKGTVYLQKFVDTSLVSVDSIQLNGKGTFTLADDIESPEIYYITIKEIPDENILFFGEKGELSIFSKVGKLQLSSEITGSTNHDLLEEYNAMSAKFNNKSLDLLKEKFEARKDENFELVQEIEKSEENLLKRKYLYTANYALLHASNEVAPYLALTELNYANIKLLDTVNNALSNEVKTSIYGVKLEKFIENIKKNE